jgi:hypothetical protein
MQINCRPYMARAHTNRRFLIAASDGAARTGPRAIRPVSCICGLGGAFRGLAHVIGREVVFRVMV